MEAYKKIALEEISKICDADEIQDMEKKLGDVFQFLEEESPSETEFWAYFDVTPKTEELKSAGIVAPVPPLKTATEISCALGLKSSHLANPFEEK